MSRKYIVDHIAGLPPKKDGAKSMWNKPVEVERLIALRKKIRESLGDSSPLVNEIKLSIRIHIDRCVAVSCGDLDNFVTGVCDGMMAAHPKASLSLRWQEPDCADIHPSRVIGLRNDGAIFAISANKICDSADPWYEIELEGN